MSTVKPDILKLQAKLDAYGFVVIEQLLDLDVTRQLNAVMNSMFDERAASNETNQHLRGVLEYVSADNLSILEAALLEPTCLRLAEQVLGADFQLAEVGARRFRPGATGLPLHVGVPANRFADRGLPPPEQCLVLTFSWLLDDLTRNNAARTFLPCSHHARRGPQPQEQYDHLAYIEAPAGSVVLFNSAVWHAIEPYQELGPSRCEFASAYVVPWLDQQELGWKAPPSTVHQQLSPHLQQLNRPTARPTS